MEVDGDGSINVQSARLRVPGGWLVRSIAVCGNTFEGEEKGSGIVMTQTFVGDDPGHNWKVLVLPKR